MYCMEEAAILKVLSCPKMGGQEGYQLIGLAFLHIANISFIQIHLRATLEQTISEYRVEEVPI